MGALLKLEELLGGSTLTLIDGSSDTGYSVMRDGFSLGSVVENPVFSRTFDGMGVRITGATKDAREQQFPLYIEDTTVGGLQDKLDALFVICDRITRKGGGVMHFRSTNGSHVTRFRITRAVVGGYGDVADYETFYRQRVTLALVVDPYGLSASYEVVDAFTQDTFGTEGVYNPGGSDWENFSGYATAPSISGGILTTASNTGATIWKHTENEHEDVQRTVRGRLNSNLASGKGFGVALKLGADGQMLCVRGVSDGAGSGAIRIELVDSAGTSTVITSDVISVAVNTWYWVRGRIEGNVVTAEWFTSSPTPMATPTVTVSSTLAHTSTAPIYGRGVSGSGGIFWHTQGITTISIDSYKEEPLTYRNVTFPATIPLGSGWAGTVDALAAIYYTGSGGTAPVSMLYSWWPKVGPHNYCWNGAAEVIGSGATTAYGWTSTAVAGVVNSCTGLTRTTTAASIRNGTAAFEASSTVTGTSGPSFPIYRRKGFRKGKRYAAAGWIRSAAGVTSSRVSLGVSGDVSHGNTKTLTTTYEHQMTQWTPTADVDLAHLSPNITTTTATTFNFDDMMVWEVDLEPAYEDDTDLDPVAYWRLGEASGLPQDAIGSNHATSVSGNPTYGNGGPIPDGTTCMDFDGTGDAVNIPYAAALNPSVFTYEAWANVDAGAGTTRVVMSTRPAGAVSGVYIAATTGNVWSAVLHDGGGISANCLSTVASSVGQWFHLAVTYDGSIARFYIDGSLVVTATDTFVANTTDQLTIGALTAGTANFNGKIANPRVYNRALTGDEVAKRAANKPSCELGGFGPGIIPGAAYNSAASSTRGTEYAQITDADYLVGYGPQGSAAITTDTGELEFPILPHLFEPDDYSSDEVEVAVFGRVELASTQVSLNCALSIAPERGTSYGARRYSNFKSNGKSLKLPSSGTVFRPFYLGKLTMRVDKSRPRREWLRLAFSNSGSATGTFGLDYIVVVPMRSLLRSQSGAAASVVPDFISSTSETTKVVGLGVDGEIIGCSGGMVVDHVNGEALTPDDGLGGATIMLPASGGAELLVWPSDLVVDATDSVSTSMAETFAGTVHVAVQPRVHMLKQG